jgi:hypothetical protein
MGLSDEGAPRICPSCANCCAHGAMPSERVEGGDRLDGARGCWLLLLVGIAMRSGRAV